MATEPKTDPPPAPPPTEDMVAGTVGAAVVLPPDSKASQGARGVYPTIQENIDHRDAGYVELGLDPADPSNSGRDPEPTPPPTQPPPPAARSVPRP